MKKTIKHKLNKPYYILLPIILLIGIILIIAIDKYKRLSQSDLSRDKTTIFNVTPTISEDTESSSPSAVLVDTSSWITYKNSNYGYSIQVPSELIPYRPGIQNLNGNLDPDNSGRIMFKLADTVSRSESNYNFQIEVNMGKTKEDCGSDEECYQNIFNKYRGKGKDKLYNTSLIETKVLGRTIKGIALKRSNLYYFYNFAIPKGQMSFTINFSNFSFEEAKKYDLYVNAIISTLTIN